MDQTTWKGFVDLLDMAGDVLQHGGNFNVSLGPYLSDVEIEPTVTPNTVLPWIVAGGLGLALVAVLLLGD